MLAMELSSPMKDSVHFAFKEGAVSQTHKCFHLYGVPRIGTFIETKSKT